MPRLSWLWPNPYYWWVVLSIWGIGLPYQVYGFGTLPTGFRQTTLLPEKALAQTFLNCEEIGYNPLNFTCKDDPYNYVLSNCNELTTTTTTSTPT
jgi:hypothetical protein